MPCYDVLCLSPDHTACFLLPQGNEGAGTFGTPGTSLLGNSDLLLAAIRDRYAVRIMLRASQFVVMCCAFSNPHRVYTSAFYSPVGDN